MSILRYASPIADGSIVGCWSTHLYCDNRGTPKHRPTLEFSGGFADLAGESLADTLRQARKRGWLVTHKLVLCPTCNGSGHIQGAKP